MLISYNHLTYVFILLLSNGGEFKLLSLLLDNHSWYVLFKIHWIAIFTYGAYLYYKNIINSPLYRVTGNQRLYFMIAIVTLLLLKATPLDVLGKHYLFSAHLLQLSFTYFIAIPLLILSFPVDFLRQLIWHHRTKLLVSLLSHPWLSLITFNGLLTLYLIPAVYTFVQGHFLLHVLFQFILLTTSIFMWWVIIQPIPEMKELNYLLRAAYIFFASLALIPIGFYFILVEQAHFPVYMQVEGVIFPSLTAVYDQQIAGGILKITQMFSYAFALLFIILEWGRREEAKEGQVDDENIRYVRGVVIHMNKDKK